MYNASVPKVCREGDGLEEMCVRRNHQDHVGAGEWERKELDESIAHREWRGVNRQLLCECRPVVFRSAAVF